MARERIRIHISSMHDLLGSRSIKQLPSRCFRLQNELTIFNNINHDTLALNNGLNLDIFHIYNDRPFYINRVDV